MWFSAWVIMVYLHVQVYKDFAIVSWVIASLVICVGVFCYVTRKPAFLAIQIHDHYIENSWKPVNKLCIKITWQVYSQCLPYKECYVIINYQHYCWIMLVLSINWSGVLADTIKIFPSCFARSTSPSAYLLRLAATWNQCLPAYMRRDVCTC